MIEEAAGLEVVIAEALQTLAKENEALAVAIEPIIYTNCKRERIGKWLGKNSKRTVLAYVRQVAELYEDHHHYLYQIQVEKSDDVWHPLFKQLQRWAYNFLLGKSFRPGRRTFELAIGYATDAAATLVDSYFPYDVSFDAWACVLLQNICRRNMRESRRQKRIPDENLLPLDERLTNMLAASDHDAHLRQELRLELLDAIRRLHNETSQRVILWRYFNNLSPAEIAEELKKSPAAVYSIHFRAVAELRKILQEKGHKDE